MNDNNHVPLPKPAVIGAPFPTTITGLSVSGLDCNFCCLQSQITILLGPFRYKYCIMATFNMKHKPSTVNHQHRKTEKSQIMTNYCQ